MRRGTRLSGERISQGKRPSASNFPASLAKGSSNTITFEYEGTLATADDRPGGRTQNWRMLGEDITYLLYPGRWVPGSPTTASTAFTATISITAPAGTLVVGQRYFKRQRQHHDFQLAESRAFPGTIIAGPFDVTSVGNTRVYVRTGKKPYAQTYAETASKRA